MERRERRTLTSRSRRRELIIRPAEKAEDGNFAEESSIMNLQTALERGFNEDSTEGLVHAMYRFINQECDNESSRVD